MSNLLFGALFGLLFTALLLLALSLCRAAHDPEWHQCKGDCGTLLPAPGLCRTCAERRDKAEAELMSKQKKVA